MYGCWFELRDRADRGGQRCILVVGWMGAQRAALLHRQCCRACHVRCFNPSFQPSAPTLHSNLPLKPLLQFNPSLQPSAPTLRSNPLHTSEPTNWSRDECILLDRGRKR